jgi:hypothetical protein
MKRNIILYASVTLLLMACGKNKDSVGSANNSWTFAGTSYTASTVVYINAGQAANLSAAAAGSTTTSADGLAFLFITPPTSSGQMLITDTDDPNTVMVAASKLSGTSTTFYINGTTNIQANVTVNNGKISISFPGKIWLHNMANFSDSAQLSIGTITQQ